MKMDEYIDSREIIEEIAQLEEIEERDEDEQDELDSLLALQAECEGYCADWEYGAQLIREDVFVDYCRELLSDCGYIPEDFPSWIEIDWDKTADNMRSDYAEVEFSGHTYLVRC